MQGFAVCVQRCVGKSVLLVCSTQVSLTLRAHSVGSAQQADLIWPDTNSSQLQILALLRLVRTHPSEGSVIREYELNLVQLVDKEPHGMLLIEI